MIIWKFGIKIVDWQRIKMPQGAKILDIQVQNSEVCMWALCDENAPRIDRGFAVYGTGHVVRNEPGEYVATVQLGQGQLVFHVFDKGE